MTELHSSADYEEDHLSEEEIAHLSPETQRALMMRDVRAMKSEMRQVRAELKTLMDLFNGAATVVRWVKLLGGFFGAVAALWVIVQPYLPHLEKHSK